MTEAKEDYRRADTHTTVEFRKATHERLQAHQRESESVAATIDRALDALEREEALPDAVVDALPDIDAVSAAEGKTNFRIWNSTHGRLKAASAPGDYLDDTINDALDALARADHLPEAVAEVCE